MPYRRITKAENPRLWKARAYTKAAPGKFRKSTKVYSLRHVVEERAGGIKIEAQVAARKSVRSSLVAHKARISRQRNKELTEAIGMRERVSAPNQRLIDKYIAGGGHFDRLTLDEQSRFKRLFHAYPEDLVRSWLGSSEESRRLRLGFRRAA